MLGKFARPVVTAAISLATAAALAAGAPAAHSAPPPAPPAAPELPRPKPGGNTLPIEVPFDNELAAVLKFAKQVGGDKILVEVLQAIIGAAGQMSPLATAGSAPAPGIKQVAATADPMGLLRQAGVQPLSPTVAPLCSSLTIPGSGMLTPGSANGSRVQASASISSRAASDGDGNAVRAE